MPRHDLPRWAPRVPKAWIQRFYENDARGLPDEELINEIAYGLLARTQSFVAACDSREGRAPCPVCRNEVLLEQGVFRCEPCDWELDWKSWFQTIQGQQLSGADPVIKLFREYDQSITSARTLQDKTLAIDRLIHGWHWNHGKATRSVGVNLIEGQLGDVIEFLDRLSYGEGSTEGLLESRDQWRVDSQYTREWLAKR